MEPKFRNGTRVRIKDDGRHEYEIESPIIGYKLKGVSYEMAEEQLIEVPESLFGLSVGDRVTYWRDEKQTDTGIVAVLDAAMQLVHIYWLGDKRECIHTQYSVLTFIRKG